MVQRVVRKVDRRLTAGLLRLDVRAAQHVATLAIQRPIPHIAPQRGYIAVRTMPIRHCATPHRTAPLRAALHQNAHCITSRRNALHRAAPLRM